MWTAALIPILLALGFAGPAGAEIYRWTDEQGNLHFSQSLDQVPAEHRAEAQASAAVTRPSRVQTYSPLARAERSHPPRPGQELRVPFRRHGSLMKVDVLLNDELSVPFYVDTGASGITLPREAADRLGIRIGPDTPRVYVSTANGVVSRPVVRLDSVQLGGARVEGLEATVNPSVSIGLLGGTFFNNFIYRVDAAEGVITLLSNQGIRGGLDQSEWRARFRRLREPLARLEAYLEGREISRKERRRELEEKLADLTRRLENLELEANRADVPQAWRQ